jgi:hypothetical protein
MLLLLISHDSSSMLLLSPALHACCCLHCSCLPQVWCDSLYAQTQRQLSGLKGFEAALLLRGLAVMQAPTPPVAWSYAVLSHTETLLEESEPKHISLLLLGLGGLRVR